MGTFSPTYENIALRCMFGDDRSTLMPNPVFVCLFTADPEIGNNFDDEVTGGGYARAEIATDDTGWTVTGSTVENAIAVAFPEATSDWASAATHWGLADDPAAALPANLICSGQLGAPVSPVTGDTPEFGIGTLVIGAD